MVGTLERLGVQPQVRIPTIAADRFLIPEQIMMRAIYFAVPEVENLRRSLNVIYGMRRGRGRTQTVYERH